MIIPEHRKSHYEDLHPIDCVQGARKYLLNNSVDLIVTDPPFAISGEKMHKHYHRNENYVHPGYEEVDASDYYQFSLNWIKEAERVLRPGGSIYIFSGYSNLYDVLSSLRQTNLREVNHLIWKYNFGVYTSKKFVSSHYHILYYVKPSGKVTFNTHTRYGPGEKDNNGRSLNYKDREDVWIINREYKPGRLKNKNELPTDLLIKIIQYSSNQGDLVVDFFLGGFSTAKIALGLNRLVAGFEINSLAFDHHLDQLKNLQPGYLLAKVKSGEGAQPPNQNKRWEEEEVLSLYQRFYEVNHRLKNKTRTIKILQEEFGRGYFAILNKIDQIQEKTDL